MTHFDFGECNGVLLPWKLPLCVLDFSTISPIFCTLRCSFSVSCRCFSACNFACSLFESTSLHDQPYSHVAYAFRWSLRSFLICLSACRSANRDAPSTILSATDISFSNSCNVSCDADPKLWVNLSVNSTTHSVSHAHHIRSHTHLIVPASKSSLQASSYPPYLDQV